MDFFKLILWLEQKNETRLILLNRLFCIIRKLLFTSADKLQFNNILKIKNKIIFVKFDIFKDPKIQAY